MHKLPKALTFMGALLALTFCAVACKTETDDDPTYYTVTVSDSIEHGKVSVDKTSAEAGATVKLTATADEGYELDSYSVKDEKSNTITVTEGTFTMPKSNVTVSATFKETAETVNQNAANAVIAKITAIGTVEYTDESKAKIDEARTAYDALTDAQKELVPEETFALLTAAESKYSELKAATEQQETEPESASYTVTIASGIANGTVTADKSSAEKGTTVTLTLSASEGYEFSTVSVKDAGNVDVETTAVTAGSKYTFTMPESNVTVTATFKETADTVNQKAAAAVIAKITAIGTVTYTAESKAKIDEARTAYDALTEAQKELVPEETLSVLTAAETAYTELKAAADSGTANKNAADAVIAKITAIGTVAYTDESKEKIDDARKAYDTLTEAQKALVPAETLSVLTSAETAYAKWTHSGIYTESNAYYINVDSQSSPSDGNGSW